MNDEAARGGPVQSTPEGGPLDESAPASAPGAGQVQATPEGGPLSADDVLVPPTWREHMKGPILGLDDVPPAASAAMAASAASDAPQDQSKTTERSTKADEELRKWPPYSGKPVSEVPWEALRYAAPLAAKAEELAIGAIDLSAKGLSRLARFLESRRQERGRQEGDGGGAR